jgi:alanyl-tRNA synthetase
VAFSIADGQLPSNTGAGYVIRRILRRAIRYGFTFLNTKEPFIYKLVEILSAQMGGSFPELKSQKTLCTNVIREEENSFLRTLDQGLILLENIITNSTEKVISGKRAFILYDTYGFPIDLTSLILRERGLELNEAEFETELQIQKDRSRAASKVKAGDWNVLVDDPVVDAVARDDGAQKRRRGVEVAEREERDAERQADAGDHREADVRERRERPEEHHDGAEDEHHREARRLDRLLLEGVALGH